MTKKWNTPTEHGCPFSSYTSGVKGHAKMAPPKMKHARSQACSIPGGFTGMVYLIICTAVL